MIAMLILVGLFMSGCTSAKNVKKPCCIQCVEAFSQSPVGVGPSAAMCGGFTSTVSIGEECDAYFQTSPMTVQQCQKLTNSPKDI